MPRPKLIEESKRKAISLTINSELDELLDELCKKEGVSKSKYIEHLLNKEIKK